MSEPTGCAGGCPRTDTYCDRCDLLVGLPGLHVGEVDSEKYRLMMTVEPPLAEQGLPVLRRDDGQPWSPNGPVGSGRAASTSTAERRSKR